MKYAVEMILFNNSWENVWHDGAGNPMLFDSREQAEDEIKDHIIDCINAVEAGEMEDSPDPTDFRVVPIEASV